MLTQTLKAICLLLFLPLFLTACADKPPIIAPPVVEVAVPPSHWLLDCRKPVLVGDKTEDLVAAYLEGLAALDACTTDKQALRNWVKEMEN